MIALTTIFVLLILFAVGVADGCIRLAMRASSMRRAISEGHAGPSIFHRRKKAA
jgi:hypothetical protein